MKAYQKKLKKNLEFIILKLLLENLKYNSLQIFPIISHYNNSNCYNIFHQYPLTIFFQLNQDLIQESRKLDYKMPFEFFAVLQKHDIPNRNGRTYPEKILKREADKYKKIKYPTGYFIFTS